MANFIVQKLFSTVLRMLETTDPAHADLFNEMFGPLLNNDEYLKGEIDKKVDKVSGKQLSANDYTTAEKAKLAGVATGAEANVQSDWSVTDTTSDAHIKNKPSVFPPANHTHGNATITDVDASKIKTGIIDIERLPKGALERCVVVANNAARFALTTAAAQTGDTVKVTDGGLMYFVIDDTKLSTEAGYTIYTAGQASAVPWAGVTGKPQTFPPSGHSHDDKVTASGGDIAATKVASFTASTASYPVPAAGDSIKVAFGKVKKFFEDIRNATAGACFIGQIVNNCVTNRADLPLSAAQGKVLMDMHTQLYSDINKYHTRLVLLNQYNLTSTVTTLPLSGNTVDGVFEINADGSLTILKPGMYLVAYGIHGFVASKGLIDVSLDGFDRSPTMTLSNPTDKAEQVKNSGAIFESAAAGTIIRLRVSSQSSVGGIYGNTQSRSTYLEIINLTGI